MDFEQLKEAVKDGNDIVEIINSYVPLKRAGVNYKALCPFHTEKTPSFTVNPTKQIFYCFGCQKGGDVIRFVMDHEGIDFVGALKMLAPRAGVQFPDADESRKAISNDSNALVVPKESLYEVHEKLTAWYHKNLRSSMAETPRSYLETRGLNNDSVTKFRLGYAPDSWNETLNWGKRYNFSPDLLKLGGIITVKNESDPITKAYDRFRDRLMFPIWNEQGRVVGFSGRVINAIPTGAKYVNSPETPIFHKGRLLYGLHLARQGIRERQSVLLCEGQMDVIACHQAGFTNAVAPLGTSFTEMQARLLKRYTDTIVLIFDADAAGINAVLKSVGFILAADLTPKVSLLEEGEDPDSIIRKSGIDVLNNAIENAEDYFSFRMKLEANRNDVLTPEGKENVVVSVLEDIVLLESVVKRNEYCRMLADRVKISESVVIQELNRIINSRKRSRVNNQLSGSRLTSVIQLENKEHLTSKAEAALLDIVIHHDTYAQKLLEDLSPDLISHNPSGLALNTALAHIEQGEWTEIESMLINKLNDYHCKEVSKALFDPDYGPDSDDKTLKKAYADCLYRGIILPRIEQEMNELQRQLQSCSSRETKAEVQREYLALRKKKSEFYSKLL